MLQQTFIHIPGIGKRREQELWEHGIRSWDDADRFEKRFGFAGARLQQALDDYIPLSREAIRTKNAAFFTRLCALGEAWRLFPEFADRCVYLDIETTGLSTVFDTVTLVGLYDGRKYRVFIAGQNLDEFAAELAKYSVVVTFNGSGFDLRFLKLAFPGLVLPPVHIDLRWVTRKLGMKGGLKEIETKFGLSRDDSVANISGFDATVLWSKFLRGDKPALDQLIQYNTEDVVHLKAIMEMAYDRLASSTAAFLSKHHRVFARVSNLPRAPRLKARTIDSENASIVDGLISRCGIGKAPRVVGIDLTGSEKRATGWALLEGPHATTKALITDEELLQETIATAADIVSIDSPLSLPDGQVSTTVLNPGVIYRKCELALKRMGISVFWCLLPSMRGLTGRGIRLARALREAGLKVIESYPGAAQDLLAIPRKKASLEELKWGMHRAGIRGEFLTAKITHDEVDAITSALVGLFYLADDYIALGTPSEDYLIVPRTPSINYARLAEITSVTGLDEVSADAHELECGVYAQASCQSAN